ncbi:Zn-dependent M28 family amino/carboxypeptidase [Mucilaginibacter gracilis]|uniref:Zn-dependent M28 family amino/carboxypeptidase n=1 Tax=Mucilaginibacter gracilis TaxID=423350 RepID=A0A495IXT6_9SPHI|nr:M20/M25/M40 family metallo-hydrolase [Mucilaginibacter gracilis]RKR81516.1 Zn-dependent M28 family amino/carboxypeptidase [Mucilaginibacter gracilis]
MIKYITALLLLLFVKQINAQDVNRAIKNKDVERIIKALSADDMQGRATFTPGIEKAARFIENEYKKAGLVPLTGNANFRQNFTMTRTTPLKTAVSINGKAIPADSAFTIAGAPVLNWSNNADVQVVKIEKNFQQEYRAYIKTGKKILALVDPKFADIFKRAFDRNKKGSLTEQSNPEQAVVFVLGSFNDVKTFAVAYTGKAEQLPLFNIVGMLPGKAKKDESVIFGGHYDHLGILPPMQGDSIANGADDDASGTTAVIALAKYYHKLKNNQRTLIFVAFTAEEIGEFGSAYFAKQVDADKVVAMFNIEMIGKASKFGVNSAFITGYERSDFGEILQRNLKGTEFKFYPDPYPKQNLFYRSDNASLARVGVPAHTISTDQIDIDKLYHTVGDEFKTLDVANITATIRAIALSSRSIVEGKDTPKRVGKLEQ